MIAIEDGEGVSDNVVVSLLVVSERNSAQKTPSQSSLYLECSQVWDNEGADLLPLDEVSSTLSMATHSTASGTYNGEASVG
jgi:hypothetical protein